MRYEVMWMELARQIKIACCLNVVPVVLWLFGFVAYISFLVTILTLQRGEQ